MVHVVHFIDVRAWIEHVRFGYTMWKNDKGARNSYIGLHWAFWGIIPQRIFVRLATLYIHASLWPKHLTNCKY